MPRKSEVLKREADKIKAKVEEEIRLAKEKAEKIQKEYDEARKKELKLVSDYKKKIEDLEKESGLFCGVELNQEDLLGIIQLAFTTREPIRIPFQLYFNDKS